MILALFDLEGTLYSTRMGHGMLRYAASHRRLPIVCRYLCALLPMQLLARFKFISKEEVLRHVTENLAWIMRGLSQEAASQVFDWLVADFILPTTREDIVRRLNEHLHQGHTPLLVSGGFMPVLSRIASYLNVSSYIGTRLEVADDQYTGRIVPPVVIGVEKARQIGKFIEIHRMAVRWDKSFAYADSIHDLSMLEMVENPVVVHPDRRLLAIATERKWEILGAG